ncbi:MAG TPA: hypothetical protein PK776_08325 [Flavobacterium sp.]|nr:hypothetical protein [Flavobacterium sp.]
MLIKKILVILNILSLIGCLIWVVKEPGWEPVVAIVGLIGALIAQLFTVGEGGNNFMMSQKGGKGSTNYQSKGDITINNNPKTTVNHYGNTETIWIEQTSEPTISSDILEVNNSDYFLELVEPAFVIDVNGYASCLPEQKYNLDILVNYKSKTGAKFYANIYPDAEDYLLHHLAHKDNVKILGRPLIGYGSIKFQLIGNAPKEPGTYVRELNIGLLHFNDWKNSEMLFNKFYTFKLVVFSTDKSNGPYAVSEINPKTGVSFMVLKENNEQMPPET